MLVLHYMRRMRAVASKRIAEATEEEIDDLKLAGSVSVVKVSMYEWLTMRTFKTWMRLMRLDPACEAELELLGCGGLSCGIGKVSDADLEHLFFRWVGRWRRATDEGRGR